MIYNDNIMMIILVKIMIIFLR